MEAKREEMGAGAMAGPITSRWPVRFFVAKEFGVADRPTDKRGALHSPKLSTWPLSVPFDIVSSSFYG